jgi:hypothetical protein
MPIFLHVGPAEIFSSDPFTAPGCGVGVAVAFTEGFSRKSRQNRPLFTFVVMG